MTIRNLVAGIVQEFHLENYQVRELPGKTVANLDAKASCIENSEIAIEDIERRMSNFELDNIHLSKFFCLDSIQFLEGEITYFLACSSFHSAGENNFHCRKEG
jgi:hypothetical protein